MASLFEAKGCFNSPDCPANDSARANQDRNLNKMARRRHTVASHAEPNKSVGIIFIPSFGNLRNEIIPTAGNRERFVPVKKSRQWDARDGH